MKWTLPIFLLIFPFAGQAEIYKCMDDQGNTMFSQQPCGDSSEIITIKPIQSSAPTRKSVTDYSETLEGIAYRTEIKKLEQRISRLNGRKRSLEKQKNTKLGELRKKREKAFLTGDLSLVGDDISKKMSKTRTSYNTKIKAAEEKIKDATHKLSELRLAKAEKDRAKYNQRELR